jgi:hypothetical protein
VERFAVERLTVLRLAVRRFAVERLAVLRFAVERLADERFAAAGIAGAAGSDETPDGSSLLSMDVEPKSSSVLGSLDVP